MNPSRPFIQRPVATSLLMAALMLAGLLALRYLPISALPQVDYPTIQVQTLYPGASPEVMTSSVTAPLERSLGQMPSLEQMVSTSSAGASVITLQFGLEISLDNAEQEVQAAINWAQNLLPSDLPAPPVYSKVNPADAPVLTMGISSTTMPLHRLQDLADTRIAQKIAQLPGVGLVHIAGGQRPAVRIQFNPEAMAAYGLNIDDLRSTIANANVNIPKGSFDGPMRSFTINANDQLKTTEAYEQLIIAYRDGAPVRLADVADVIEGPENIRIASWTNATPAVILSVQRQPGANVIDVVDRIHELLPRITASLPQDVTVKVLTDRTVTIRASVDSVAFELSLAVVLVVAVIFVFLRSLPATVIPSLSVPLSLVGTLAVMYLAGFSLNNLSLMALTIATGFVVDDAIVVIENISRYIERGLPSRQAALKGAEQIGFTIVSLTISLVAVLIPLLFMEDVVGRLFREFAVTLSVTVLLSAVVSLTLVPMMCAKLLRHRPAAELSAAQRSSQRWFDALVALYGRLLNRVLDHQGITLVVAVATLALTVILYVTVPKGFFPVQDTGVIQAVTEADQTISFAAMAERQQALAERILADPDVVSLASAIGIDGINTTLNAGRMLINLKPKTQRSADVSAIMQRIGASTADVAGIRLFMQPVQDLTIDTTASRTQYRFVVVDPDPERLAEWLPRIMERLKTIPEVVDVGSDAQNDGLALFVDIDRDSAARFGITPATIGNALYGSFGQRIISTIFTQSNQYRVIMEAAPDLQGAIQSLELIRLPSAIATNGQVPLTAVAHIRRVTVPLVQTHLSQFPAATLSFNLAPGVSLSDAVGAITAATQEMALPDSLRTEFQGTALAFQKSLSNQLFLILAAIITVYIVLGILYESYVHPITILSTLPSAGVGALLALLIAGRDLDVIAIIGIILLIGIVKKNAIMMIDFALEAERREGKAPRDAIYQACLLRFRPILMTTMAAMFGALPLMLGSGTGSELRQPLGLTIVGGLIVSQVLTLFTTPVIYLAFDRLRRLAGATDADADADAEGLVP